MLTCSLFYRNGRLVLAAFAIAQTLLVGAPRLARGDEASRLGLEFFETKIRPMLVEHCYACHSEAAQAAGKLRGGLLLDAREAARKGGESGAAVVPGKPGDSLLIDALKHETFEMPPKGKLPDNVIADFVRWVEMGAPDPRDGTSVQTKGSVDLEAGRRFWSFQPLQKNEPPADPGGWSRTAVDRFVVARQRAAGLHPNGVAETRILIRRAWFDLLGLPPSPEEMSTWTARLTAPASLVLKRGETASEPGAAARGLKAQSTANVFDDAAWGELIDHLLASPHYGERWARHWMDVARFAESDGYEHDHNRPYAYRYRDFLIRAFNDDLPYDRFVSWQLAGDELAPEEPLAWMATGFLCAGTFPTQLSETEFESARYDELDDMVATTGVTFLGLSVGCARCHDHKFDPIPSRDYYNLAATFTTAIRCQKEFDFCPEQNAERQRAFEARRSELQEELRLFEGDVLPVKFRGWLAADRPETAGAAPDAKTNEALSRLTGESDPRSTDWKMAIAWFKKSLPDWQARRRALDAHEKAGPERDVLKILATSEGLPHLPHNADGRGFPHYYPHTHVLRRGDVQQKIEPAQAGFLQVLLREGSSTSRWRVDPPAADSPSSFRRSALAAWMTDAEFGAGHLAARVAVNRVWQHHFGKGLVATPNDFGASGEPPTHPELLDWLAADFVDNGWRLKRLHKLLMTSSVYLQSSDFDPARSQLDRENVWHWRRVPQRLEAEPIRDAMLAVSGRLDRTLYGPGTLDANTLRRSVYFFIKRSELIPAMMLFDWPEHLVSIGNRASTTIAPQALLFMNNPQARDCAGAFASTLSRLESREAVGEAYRRALGRDPNDEEVSAAVAFLKRQRALRAAGGGDDAARQALADLCQTIFSTNEFIYVD